MRPIRIRTARTLLAAVIALAVLSLAGPSGPLSFAGPDAALAAKCSGADKNPRKISRKRAAGLIVCLVNKERRQHGKHQLKRKGAIGKAAGRHTKAMQASSCFSHTCSGEPDLGGRLQRTSYLPCNCSWGAGENIAYGRKQNGSPRGIFQAWMNSSEHRAAILNGSFRHVGVGVRWGTPYERKGRKATYTMDFGYKH